MKGIAFQKKTLNKFYIFKSAIESGHTTVAFIGILASIISVYYYLRVVYMMYMREPAAAPVEAVGDVFTAGALAIAMLGILIIGIYPTPLFTMAGAAARLLLQ